MDLWNFEEAKIWIMNKSYEIIWLLAFPFGIFLAFFRHYSHVVEPIEGTKTKKIVGEALG
jgi:hypothetical protein